MLAGLTAVIAAAAWYLHGHNIPVMEPAGQVGAKERNLILLGLMLSAIVVVPVYAMAIAIAVRYREENHKTKKVKYRPDWDHNRWYEAVWWGVPIIIIAILSVITWNSSHELDPYKKLSLSKKPLTIQVVAMDWKWLFIYPEQHIASVNMIEMPRNMPVNFYLTSDTVMNSFWIPQLGSQIYAMPGMITQLHLVADKTGSYYGSPANIAGKGFARMTFTAKAVSDSEFNNWLKMAAGSNKVLNEKNYQKLSKPSEDNPVAYYSNVDESLYNDLVMKYMMPMNNGPGFVSNLKISSSEPNPSTPMSPHEHKMGMQ